MPLVNPIPMLKLARQKGAAIAALNVQCLDMLPAIAAAAAKERAPLIIQGTPGSLKFIGIEYLAAAAKSAAEQYDIPIALHADHNPSIEEIEQCIRHGFTSVMIDASELPYEQNVEMVNRVRKLAHNAGVAVEGEIGRVGGTEDDMTVDEQSAALTVPGEALAFAEETGVDFLAVAIGTAHGVYKGTPKLDFERLAEIRRVVKVPLVLHGASGVPDESVRKSIECGICKVNIATELKIPMAEAIRRVFADSPGENDPRKYMGAGRNAVEAVATYKIRLCGASGLADLL